jgi:hypothetical protein
MRIVGPALTPHLRTGRHGHATIEVRRLSLKAGGVVMS